MAPRKTVLRLVLMAALAALLSGCYAHGGGYSPYYGGGYAYGGGSHYAPSGHAYHRSGRRAHRRHGYRYRGW